MVRFGNWELERQGFFKWSSRWRYGHAQRVMACRIWYVKDARFAAQNDSPIIRTGYRPHAVGASRERLPRERDSPTRRERRRLVGAWAPLCSIGHDSAE